MIEPRPSRVLVIDDDRDLLFLTTAFLSLSGALRVETADSPHKALEELAEQQYDAVVCDYEMPLMNGIEVLKEIRKCSEIPFILFTGKGREDVVIDALNNGADFYLQKGADPSSLFRELEHMIIQATDRRRFEEQLQRSNIEMAYSLEDLRSAEESIYERNKQLEHKEKELLESRENYRSLFEQMLIGCAVHEAIMGADGSLVDYRFIAMNSAFEQMTGLNKDDAVGRTVREIWPDIEPLWFERYGNVVSTGQPIHFDNFSQALGRHYEVMAFRNRPGQFAVTALDVTDRRHNEDRAQEAIEEMNVTLEELRAAQEQIIDRNRDLEGKEDELERSKLQYHQLFRERIIASALLEVVDGPGGRGLHFLDVNSAFEHLLRVGREQVIGRDLGEVFQVHAEDWNALLSVADTGQPMEPRAYAPRPGAHFEISAYRPQENKVALSVMDITARKRAEEELQRSEALVRSILDASPDGITVVDLEGRITYCSPRAAQMLGVQDPQEVRGTRSRDWLARDEKERAQENIDGFKNGGEKEHDRNYQIVRKDGSTMIVEINSAFLYGADGARVGVVSSLRDTTERKHLDMAIKRANQKLNLLSSVTRHDIQNQLVVLQGYLMMARNLTAPEDLDRCMSRMEAAADNIGRQISFTKEYQDIGIRSPQWAEPAAIWEGVGDLLSHPNVTLRSSCNDIEVFADPLFNKVLYTLVENSLRHGGRVSQISLDCRQAEGGVELIIEDDGVGIDHKDKYRIFEKGYGRGTGLGLFLAKEILSITGATIQETGEPGKGARFEIFFHDGDWRPR